MPSRQRKPQEFSNRGVEIPLSPIYERLEVETIDAIEPVWKKYPKASKLWDVITADRETRANWDMANYLSVSKMSYTAPGVGLAVIVVARTRADAHTGTRIIQQLYFENGVFKNE